MTKVLIKNSKGEAFQLINKLPLAKDGVVTASSADVLPADIRLTEPVLWSEAFKLLFPKRPMLVAQDAIVQAINVELKAKALFLIPADIRAQKIPKKMGGSSKSVAPTYIAAPAATPPADNAKETPNDKNAVSSAQPAQVSATSECGAPSVENTCTNGCPISMVSGEELLSLTDFSLPGPLPFVWRRTYRSGHDRDTGLGHGWTHSANEQLYEAETHVELRDDEGRTLSFKRPRINQRSQLINEQLSLDSLAYDVYVLRKQGEPHKIFTRLGHTGNFRLTHIQHPAYKPASDATEDALGFALTLHYNAQNALSRIASNWGKSLRFTRDAHGHITQVILVDEVSNQQRLLAEYEYNGDNDLIAHRDGAGRGEQYRYKNHLFVQRTLATGFNYYYEWNGDDTRARCLRTWGDNGIYDYRFTWHPEKNVTLSTDSRGYTKEYTYNEFGLITQEVDNEGGIHRYEYENGLRSSYTDPEGNITAYAYDEANRAIGVIDALDQRQTHYYFQDKLTSSTDKDGAHWQRTYNSRGLLETLTAPDGQATHYRYNAQGLLTQQTDAHHSTTRYQWNDQGELVALINPEGHKQEFRYNLWGQLIQMDIWLASRAHGGTTHYAYNDSHELIRITYPTRETVDIHYNANGQIERVSDRRGRVTHYQYDGLSQVIRRTDAEGHSLKYRYDTERNLIRLTNENGEDYEFVYDGNERLIKEIGFDGRTQEYHYNKAGFLVKHLDAGEVITEFERDALGRMLKKTSRRLSDNNTHNENNRNAAAEVNRYLYDPVGRLKETYNNHQYLAFKYDRRGRLIAEHHTDINDQRQRVIESAVDIHYQRNSDGQLQRVHLPHKQHIDYHYDKQHRLHEVLFNETSLTKIQRDELGFEIERQQGTLSTHSEYDPMGRLLKQQTQHQKSNAAVINREYAYDPFGNLSVFKDGVSKEDNWEVRYVYDMVDRLKRTQGDLNEHFVFDPASNLLAQENASDTNKSNSNTNTKRTNNTTKGNRLRLQGDRKFTYDARGNLIKESRGKDGKLLTLFEYNCTNQLIKVSKHNQTTEYAYDPLGRRIRKQDNFGVTNYIWAGDQLAQEQRNNIRKTYIYEPDSFKPLAMVQDGEIYHYHLDHLGTPHELTNQQGKLVWKAHYKTYGNVALKPIEEIENNLRFQGQYFDEETGLHYNRHRYYDPSLGQFTTQDPIGLLGGINNYQYAPNPTGWIDPLGLVCKEITLKDVKFKSIWGGEGLNFFVRGDDGEELSLGMAEISEDMDSVTFGIFNNDNPGITIKPVGFSLTEALISISILEIMENNSGIPPSNLPGGLADSNKYNYQKEYARAINQGLNGNDAKQEAIKSISFGKHRQNIGYSNMEIVHGRETTITHDSKGNLLGSPLENVPSGINVKEAKLTDRNKLDKTLEKYKGVHKDGRE